MLTGIWIPFNSRSLLTVSFQFVDNIKRVKGDIKELVVEKRSRDDRELKLIEEEIMNILDGDGGDVESGEKGDSYWV